MAILHCCGLECGGGNGAHITGTTGYSVSTSTVRNGSRSARVNGTGNTARASFTATVGTQHAVSRTYVRFASLPTGNSPILGQTVSANSRGVWFDQSESKLYCGTASETYGASGVSVTTGQWYRIDLYINASANPWVINAQVDGTALGQVTYAAAAASLQAVTFGDSSANWTGDFYVDDFVWADTAGDYPIGAGYVHHFVPTSDGTHNIAGTADFQRGNTGTDILNATTTAYQLVDDVPLPSGAVDEADCLRAVAPPNATDYVEVKFGPASGIPTPTVAPSVVAVLAAYHQAATQVGQMVVTLNDNGTVATILDTGAAAGVTSYRFGAADFNDPPSAATAWNVLNDGSDGDFLDLRARFRAPDAAPDQMLDAIMIEAAFADTTAPRVPRDRSTPVQLQPILAQ